MGWGNTMFQPAATPDPWEEEQKRREEMMAAALMGSEAAQMGPPENPGSVTTPPTPENQYLDQYAQHIQNMPRQEDYKAGKLRTILGIIGGTLTRNPDLTDAIVHGKYNNAMNEWNRQGQDLKNVAQFGVTQRGQDVTGRGQDIGVQEGERTREFQAGEGEANRASREEVARLGRESSESTASEDRASRERIASANRDVDRIRANAYSRSVDNQNNMMSRTADLTPQQRTAAWDLAVQRVMAGHPEWAGFADEKGVLPYEGGGWLGLGGMDQAEYEKFVKAVEEEFGATSGRRVTSAPGMPTLRSH